jgi:glucose-1-phosphate adenylyltransferase
MPGRDDVALASMGIYVFNADFLYDILSDDAGHGGSSHDFGRDVIPSLIGKARVRAHPLGLSAIRGEDQSEPYWRDVGTIDAYWEANIDLTRITPALDLYDASWPVYTYQEQLPPAKFVWNQDGRRGTAIDSTVSGGCIISGATVKNSLLSSRVRVNSYARLDGAVVLPRCNIGRGARLTNVVVDSGCDIPEDFVVGEDPVADAARFERTDKGITLITPAMLDALG